jgi:hypothetical protein
MKTIALSLLSILFVGVIRGEEVPQPKTPQELAGFVEKALKEQKLESILALYCWEGVHQIHRDERWLSWERSLAKKGAQSVALPIVKVEWVAIDSLDQDARVKITKTDKVQGRTYRQNLVVRGIVRIVSASEDGSMRQEQALPAGMDEQKTWRLTETKVEQAAPSDGDKPSN